MPTDVDHTESTNQPFLVEIETVSTLGYILRDISTIHSDNCEYRRASFWPEVTSNPQKKDAEVGWRAIADHCSDLCALSELRKARDTLPEVAQHELRRFFGYWSPGACYSKLIKGDFCEGDRTSSR
jgi:hypothetical protein